MPRLVVPNQPHHVIQRGTDGTLIFRDLQDHQMMLRWLREASRLYHVAIHAYVLMSNHLHLLASPSTDEGLAKMMQWIGRQYVPYFNRRHQRTGTLWQGRYRTCVIDTERYLLICSRYIELNPVRAGMCTRPADYPWSSCAHHIGLRRDPLVTEHDLYWRLGNTPFEREAAYRSLIDEGLDQRQTEELRQVLTRGWSLGSQNFKHQLSLSTNRKVEPGQRGRPRKSGKPRDEDLPPTNLSS